MDNATRLKSYARHAGSLLVRFAHGSLLTVGLFGVAWFGARLFDHESIGFADTGIVEAHAAVVDAPAPVAPVMEPRVASPAPAVLSAEMKRVRDYVARRYRVSTHALEPVLVAAELNGKSHGLDPMLIVAVMAIESSFNPFAESHMGAQGLMQVIPRFHMDKIGDDSAPDALFDPLLNVRVGTQVLVEGLQRFGDLQAALQYYGGARDDPNAAYANKVFEMRRKLLGAAGRKAGADV